jgi:hypothetical protein
VKLAGEGAAEAGAGPGSYDIRKSVWHVNVSLRCQLCEAGEDVVYSQWNSAAHPSTTAMVAGESSTLYSDGKTQPHTAPSSRTISTGSPSLLGSCSLVGRRTSRIRLRVTKLLARRRVSREMLQERKQARKASLLRQPFEKFTKTDKRCIEEAGDYSD